MYLMASMYGIAIVGAILVIARDGDPNLSGGGANGIGMPHRVCPPPDRFRSRIALHLR